MIVSDHPWQKETLKPFLVSSFECNHRQLVFVHAKQTQFHVNHQSFLYIFFFLSSFLYYLVPFEMDEPGPLEFASFLVGGSYQK